MENIYGQTDDEMNSVVPLPERFAENAGNTLYSWLGSLWHGLNMGDGMVKGLQSARGIRLAQMYLNILEAAKLQDRNGAPVFHRELWHPIVIRRSTRNTAQENMLKVGGRGTLGPQTSEEPYGIGTVLKMGKLANFADFVTYPVDAAISGGVKCIVDNIVNPTVRMELGTDFELRNGSIIFHKDMDPLEGESAFDRYDLPDFYVDPDDPERKKRIDAEAVLWASDVLIDRNYISDHISYALGADAPSSAVVKRILNAAWSSVSCGLTPELMKTLMAAMLNVPVIQNDEEMVVDIVRGDGWNTVYTDHGEYRISKKAKLRKYVYSGSKLHRGDFLDESVRIYPFLDSLHHMRPKTPFSRPVELDIPSISLPPEMLRARTEYGVYAMWGSSKVKRSVASPGSAYSPHLYFDIGGIESDVSAFWNDVWKNAESSGKSMLSLLVKDASKEAVVDFRADAEYESGDMVIRGNVLHRCISAHSGPWDASHFETVHVSPADFIARNLIGANTVFVVVDESQTDDASMMHDPMFFDMLSSVVPSAMRLFVVERRNADEDVKDLDDETAETESVAASLPSVAECASASEMSVMDAGRPSFGECVSIRFVRPAPARVRGIKEEE